MSPGSTWHINRDEFELRSADCIGVWWRRPEVPAVPAGADAASDAVADQWRTFIASLATVPGATWVSEPANIRAAENKAAQLRRAADIGLQVPETLWTNDTDDARAFIERWHGTAVVKSVATAWWEEADRGRFVFASLVGLADLPASSRLASAPVCFQQAVTPKRDIRVTVVEDAVLAAVRDADGGYEEHLDWRRGPQRAWSPYELPDDIASCCCALVRSFGLRFGGVDLALDDDGRHWFLELNPNGEWGWLQRAGLPIAEALADTLLCEAS